mmetsp:Transcript_19304/g.32291  ORF Transcript_19304/g.32291 Transcript_19304/m.32291 type:complete len:207 (+) Transcript_19304:124-744(+)
MDTDSSNSSELCDKFALIQAWQAVDRLITVVNHELKNCKDVENLTNYCENTGMITVKVSDYVASCQFSPEVWSRLFSRKKNSVKWRDLAKDEGRITFDNVSQPFERRKIQLHTSEMMRSCVPWDWFFKTMMKPSEQQGSAQEYLYPSTPGNNLVSQVTEGILESKKGNARSDALHFRRILKLLRRISVLLKRISKAYKELIGQVTI